MVDGDGKFRSTTKLASIRWVYYSSTVMTMVMAIVAVKSVVSFVKERKRETSRLVGNVDQLGNLAIMGAWKKLVGVGKSGQFWGKRPKYLPP